MIPPYVQRQARLELSRRYFYDYCQNRYPQLYKPERTYLKDIADTLQHFIYESDKKFLTLSVPPRHIKSMTAGNLTEWLLGRDKTNKIITGSYNETLSTIFAKKVRNSIQEVPADDKVITFHDVFPDVNVKRGDAAMSLWSLEGNNQPNYLATSPTGTATGIGANIVIIDDPIKSDVEALNENVLQKHWDWFSNTIMQRLEGDYKVIIVMTRWATNDLAGRIIQEYGDLVEVVSYKAKQDDGAMLCDDILTATDYELKTSKMMPEIASAVYQQEPMDIKGRLYKGFREYDVFPDIPLIKNYTDTADTGSDFLCSISYGVLNDDVYIKGVYFSDEDAEITEPEVASLLDETDTNKATFESNNGGRFYARNVEEELKKLGNKRTVIEWKAQSKNKEARILSSSAWVAKHVIMPKGWGNKWEQFYKNIMTYNKKGKNAHDDAPDVLAAIYESENIEEVEYMDASELF